MSEKEERIFIGTVEEGEVAEWCVASSECMTRSEAVERMANAMSDTYFNDVHASEPDMLEKMAEAALDALIKGV